MDTTQGRTASKFLVTTLLLGILGATQAVFPDTPRDADFPRNSDLCVISFNSIHNALSHYEGPENKAFFKSWSAFGWNFEAGKKAVQQVLACFARKTAAAGGTISMRTKQDPAHPEPIQLLDINQSTLQEELGGLFRKIARDDHAFPPQQELFNQLALAVPVSPGGAYAHWRLS